MAGGSGERFWPLSRAARPKQLLHLASETETLLQEAVSRIVPLIPAERVFVATSLGLRDVIREGDSRVPAENVLAEPCKRNTAGCLIWAAASLLARFGSEVDPVMAVLTADHQIGDHARFRATVDAALRAAETSGALVTIGMKPQRPETGYGYIEMAPDTKGELEPVRVRRFREKPSLETAQQFAASPLFLWNSGMFFWRVSSFLAQLESARPEMAAGAARIAEALRRGDECEATRHFEGLESISIDYALLERATEVLVIPGAFHWEDVGSWDALDRTRPHDADGNVAIGDTLLLGTRDCIVVNDAPAGSNAVAVVGMKDTLVVVSGDSVLVASKHSAQDIRRVVEELRARGARQV
ncbi:mannose-1-phosphate guanylyltransferase [Candidatus Poribacteria bacterium]|nr:mannose-1-phosphate guanylyltransferase [Candidatus Poribacteria bacterium]